jgi:hypothetical protein
MRALLATAALAVLLVVGGVRPAAADARLGVGADYWWARRGVFGLTLAVDTHLARHLAVGGRFGAALIVSDPHVAVPIDLQLRVPIQRIYLEMSAGPWIFFEGDPVRAHVAFGFGIASRAVSFGVELGWLDPSTIIGVRLSFHL